MLTWILREAKEGLKFKDGLISDNNSDIDSIEEQH